MKKCSKCGEVKPLDAFAKNASKKDGKSYLCRECTNEAMRLWREANPEKARENARRCREAHPEKVREHNQRWYAANAEKAKEASRRRHAANPERVRESSRRRYAADPEKARRASRQWQKDNPEKKREMGRRWCAANREKLRELGRKKYADNPEKIRKAANDRTKQRQAKNYSNLIELFGSVCLDCGREYPMQILEYHHPDPKTKRETLNVSGWSWARVESYVRGCVQLCPTCHRMRHFLARKKSGNEVGVVK